MIAKNTWTVKVSWPMVYIFIPILSCKLNLWQLNIYIIIRNHKDFTCHITACHVASCSSPPWAEIVEKSVCAALFLMAECSLTHRSAKRWNSNIHTASNTGRELTCSECKNNDECDLNTVASLAFVGLGGVSVLSTSRSASREGWTEDWFWNK